MPVDTSAINTILGAYAQGAQIRQRREAQKFAEQEAIAQQTLRRQQFEEETKRQEAALKLQEERDKATQEFRKKQQEMQSAQQKVSMIGAKAQIAEHIQKSGITPPGFKRELAGMLPDTDEVYYKYTSEDDPNFNVVLPSGITHARQVAAQQREIMQPKMEFEAQKSTQRLQLEADKLNAQHQSKMLVEEERTKRAREAADAKYKRDLEVARVRASSAKSPAAKAEAELDKPLSPSDIADLNRANPDKQLAYGAKRRDAVGMRVEGKLTAAAQEDLRTLDEVEIAGKKLETLLSKNEGLFKDYFAGKGIGGRVKEIGRKFEGATKEELAEARRLIGTISTLIGHEKFGASFTGGEKEQLRTFVPHSGRDQIYLEVKTQLKGLLESARRNRLTLLTGRPGETTPGVREDKVDSLINKHGR